MSSKKYQETRNIYKKENGICRHCEDKVCIGSTRFCEKHVLHSRRSEKEYKDKNKDKIKQKRIRYRDRNLSAGLCTKCKNVSIRRCKTCEKCFYQNLSLAHLGSVSLWKELKEKLVNQNFKCYYTGYTIDIEEGNAAIDHVKPRSLFPELSKDINNLVWCEKSFNRAKSNRSVEEFIPYFLKVGKSFIEKYERENLWNEEYHI